ncbi:hypothetical protein Dimus_005116, partial [Dionaea muscipula]
KMAIRTSFPRMTKRRFLVFPLPKGRSRKTSPISSIPLGSLPLALVLTTEQSAHLETVFGVDPEPDPQCVRPAKELTVALWACLREGDGQGSRADGEQERRKDPLAAVEDEEMLRFFSAYVEVEIQGDGDDMVAAGLVDAVDTMATVGWIFLSRMIP